MTDDLVTLTIDDGVAVLRLNRAEHRNAIDLPVAVALRRAVERLARLDPADVGAVLVCGAGDYFSVGGDIAAMAAADRGEQFVDEVAEQFHHAILTLHELDLVIVAAVQGAVAGGALGLVLVADLVIATPQTTFAAAWSIIGLTPDGGATWMLPRIVGSARAARMILADHRLDGAEALEWGLAAELVPTEALQARALELAGTLAQRPRPALGRTRRLLRSGWATDLATQLDRERVEMAQARRTSDAHISQFLRRRRR